MPGIESVLINVVIVNVATWKVVPINRWVEINLVCGMATKKGACVEGSVSTKLDLGWILCGIGWMMVYQGADDIPMMLW